MEENQLLENEQKVEDNRPFDVQIEERRKELLAYYKKSKRISTINIIVVLSLVIGGFILFAQEALWMKIVGGSVMGVCVIYMLTHYLLTKKKLPTRVQGYIAFVTALFNKNDYEEPDFKDVTFNVEEKIDQSVVLADAVYKDYSNYVSRNVIKGKYKGVDFTSGEIALYANGEKNTRVTIFVGKYISFPNTIKCKSRYLYNARGEKELDLPNNFDGITEIDTSGHIHVYGIEGVEKGASISKIVNALKSIRIDSPLLNINLVIWEGHSGVYLSFDDTVMGLPFEKEFNAVAHNKAKDIIKEVFELLNSLNQ